MGNYLISLDELKAGYYDPQNSSSVYSHAQKLLGNCLKPYLTPYQLENWNRTNGKGNFGNVLEEAFFKIKNNTSPLPDIPECMVEIKSGQIKFLANNRLGFKERIKLSMIDYQESFSAECLRDSKLWLKLEKILLMLFLHDSNNRINQLCKVAEFLEWSDDDISQMSEDWVYIKKAVLEGRANELSEGHTWYLGACTAGANSKKLRKAPGTSLAKTRAFSLKKPFLNYKFGYSTNVNVSKVIIPPQVGKSLERTILDSMSFYFGKSLNDIALSINRGQLLERFSKNLNSRISRALLEEIANTRSDNLSTEFKQFRQAGVIERTVSLQANGSLRESISFPAFKWTDINLEDEWQESELYSVITSKFFFTVCQKSSNELPVLIGCFFWTMPQKDINKMESLWRDTKDKISKGDYNNFIKKTEHDIGHVRPHAQNANDTFATPQGGQQTKQSFWLNNDYVLNSIKSELRL